jgi:hypothetical protein
MNLKRVLLAAGQAALLLWAGAAWAQASYPTPEQVQIAKTGKYMGSESCLECHEDEHKSWVTSRHTLKVTKGPAFGKEFEKNIYQWVRRD